MPDARLQRTRSYVPPPASGLPYARRCGCRGEKGEGGRIHHYACRAHQAEALQWIHAMTVVYQRTGDETV